MKIKYISGDRRGEVVDIDVNIGTYFVACGLAVEVKEPEKPSFDDSLVQPADDPQPKPKKRGRKPKKAIE